MMKKITVLLIFSMLIMSLVPLSFADEDSDRVDSSGSSDSDDSDTEVDEEDEEVEVKIDGDRIIT
ncbi:hypothetical protein ISS07_06960, partial [Candidatus Woesearchaeota archaeon]|nr:hypothetical protein [Candidatus Woesearchaeota archaeon]